MMQQYNPFQITQDSSNRSNKIHMENMDSGNLDNILSNAMKSNDKDVLQSTISSLLSKVKDPQKQQIGLNLIQNRMQTIKANEDESKQISAFQQAGFDPSLRNLPANLQNTFLEQKNKARDDQNEIQAFKDAGFNESFRNLPANLQTESVKNRDRQNAMDRVFGNQQNQNQQGQDANPIDPNTNPNQQGVEPPKQQSFNDLNEDDLVMLTGSPYREISEPAKARLKSLQKEKENEKSLFESESEKLEAKSVSDYAKSIETEYESARGENMRLDRQLQLSDEGNVSTPALIAILDYLDIPIGVLQNPATEEYRKIESDFVRDVSKVFPGGKITNYEVSAYMKTIPTLMNSEEGKRKIIQNRKLLNDPKVLKYQEYQKILKENNGKKPSNLFALIEERTASRIAKIEDEFASGIKSDVQKYETPLRMTGPNGENLMIPPSQIENALKAGAKFNSE